MLKEKRHVVVSFLILISIVMFSLLYLKLSQGSQRVRFNSFVVLSDSMEPKIKTNSLLITEKISEASLNVGDIITFKVKENMLVTHEIYDIVEVNNNRQYQTISMKSDKIDPWTLSDDDIIGRLIFVVPYIGVIIRILHHHGFIILMTLVLISLISLFRIAYNTLIIRHIKRKV